MPPIPRKSAPKELEAWPFPEPEPKPKPPALTPDQLRKKRRPGTRVDPKLSWTQIKILRFLANTALGPLGYAALAHELGYAKPTLIKRAIGFIDPIARERFRKFEQKSKERDPVTGEWVKTGKAPWKGRYSGVPLLDQNCVVHIDYYYNGDRVRGFVITTFGRMEAMRTKDVKPPPGYREDGGSYPNGGWFDKSLIRPPDVIPIDLASMPDDE